MNRKGYIIPLTLMIIATAIALLTSLLSRSFAYQKSVHYMARKMQTRQLAIAGIHIAMAQAALIVPEEKKGEEKPEQAQSQQPEQKTEKFTPKQQWIQQLLPIINTWQTLKLTADADGIDATIQLYIASEQGKINLTQLLKEQDSKKESGDQAQENKNKTAANKKEDPKRSWQSVIYDLLNKAGIAQLDGALKKFKEKHGRAPDDVSELLEQDAAKAFKSNIFIAQPENNVLKTPIYLMDLFTTATQTEKINPWLLSKSLTSVLGFKKSDTFDIKDKIKEVKPFVTWSQQWDKLLEPRYGKKFATIEKEITPLFAASFDASVCSVICYAQVQNVTQKIYAIIEKARTPEGMSSKSIVFRIKRLYWL